MPFMFRVKILMVNPGQADLLGGPEAFEKDGSDGTPVSQNWQIQVFSKISEFSAGHGGLQIRDSLRLTF